MPWAVAAILMFAIYLGICFGMRVLHNLMHKKEKKIIKSYYMQSPEFQSATIEEAVAALAKNSKVHDPKNNDVIVPRRVLRIMVEKFDSKKPIEELCDLYVNEYLK